MKITKLGTTLALTTLATAVLALPTFFPVFETTYSIKKNSNIKKASCALCHVGFSAKLNPYGLDLKTAVEATAGTKTEAAADSVKKITAETLKKVEELDSDKDGVKNGDEIRGDSLPGDPKSVPVKK
jgi:hypothetical protein